MDLPVLRTEIINERYGEAQFFFTKPCGATGRTYDNVKDCLVAIKKRYNLEYSQRVAITTLRDIAYLKVLIHDNIIKLYDVIGAKHTKHLPQIYYTLELMSTSVEHYVLGLQGENLNPNRIRNWMVQILLGVYYIHSAGIVHRDLKPSNILVSQSLNEIKIADFDLARMFGPHLNDLTEGVSTSFIKAPELLLKPNRYLSCIDIWALGCTFYFLWQGENLFHNLNHDLMLGEIFRVIGTANAHELRNIPSQKAQQILNGRQEARVVWRQKMPGHVPDLAVNLLERMMQFCEIDRIFAQDALYHDYFAPERAAPNWRVDVYEGNDLHHFSSELTIPNIRANLKRRITVNIPQGPLEQMEMD